MMKVKEQINRHLSNLPGWRTNRHLIVIESDDWGSIRMSSKKARENLENSGIQVSNNHYNSNDGLESNKDLEALMELLEEFRDSSGRPPVITGANITANPDFDKILEGNFEKYYYQSFVETTEMYPEHDNIHQLWREAMNSRLIAPEFHGREHLNVQRWMRALQEGCKATHLAFENRVTGISRGIDGVKLPKYQAAFDIDSPDDLDYQAEVITSGADLFENLFGYRAKFFIPTNGPFNNMLEETVKEVGIAYLGTGKIQVEPQGNNKYKKHFRYLGKQNDGITYLTRNAFFEPCSWAYPSSKDWVNDCLKEIEIAFFWGKPATISSHRVNYIGWLNEDNRTKGLRKLRELLKEIIKKWPDVEFLTSRELGDLIVDSKK